MPLPTPLRLSTQLGLSFTLMIGLVALTGGAATLNVGRLQDNVREIFDAASEELNAQAETSRQVVGDLAVTGTYGASEVRIGALGGHVARSGTMARRASGADLSCC